MRNGRLRAKDESNWKRLYAEAKVRDDIRAIEKQKQNEQMPAKCNNFEINRADGYSIDQHKTALETQISNFEQVKAQSERYNAAPKLSCKRANMTLPNGERITGVWKIVSAYHIIPSHNPETFADSPNFPLNESGKNVNDRNYATDRMAQSFVASVAQRFDGRAIEEPIRISRDGIVVDGNNRTMSRILAHKQNTDMAYIEALHDLASEKCMCHEDIAQIEAPTMVFEIDTEPNYSRQYFAQFNANTKKEKTTVDQVITLASTVSQRVRNIINAEFDKYENISELYASRPSVQAIRNALIDGGVIMESEFNKYFDATIGSFTDDGKKMLQRIVLSGILSEDNVRVLDTDGMKNINEKLLYAIVSVTVNQSMPEEFALKAELNAAIDILHSASRAGMSVADLISQGSMFAETEVKADYESLTVAIFISKSKAQFKKIMNVYNTAAKSVQGGSLFGEVDNRDKRQILKDTIEWMLTEKMLTDADKYALQRFEKLAEKPKTVADMLPSSRKKLNQSEKEFLTKQVKKETEKQEKLNVGDTVLVKKGYSPHLQHIPLIITDKYGLVISVKNTIDGKEFALDRKWVYKTAPLEAPSVQPVKKSPQDGKNITDEMRQDAANSIAKIGKTALESMFIDFAIRSTDNSKDYDAIKARLEILENISEDDLLARELVSFRATKDTLNYLLKQQKQTKPTPSVPKPKNDLRQYTKGKWFYEEINKLYYKVREADSEKIYFDIYEYGHGNLELVNKKGIFKNPDAPIWAMLQAIEKPIMPKHVALINDLKTALKYIKDSLKIQKYTSLIADLELAAKYAK